MWFFLFDISDEMAEINTLGWFDYLIIAIMLCIGAGIGIITDLVEDVKKL